MTKVMFLISFTFFDFLQGHLWNTTLAHYDVAYLLASIVNSCGLLM